MEAGCRDHAESGQDGGDGRSDGEAGNRQIRWRVEERTKKADPAVNDPAVAIQKPKQKGGERVEIRGGDERCDQARVDEEPVPLLHGYVEGLDVREFPWETTRKAGE